jgi:hypothetical protein
MLNLRLGAGAVYTFYCYRRFRELYSVIRAEVWNPNVYNLVHKSTLLDPLQGQINSVPTFTPCFNADYGDSMVFRNVCSNPPSAWCRRQKADSTSTMNNYFEFTQVLKPLDLHAFKYTRWKVEKFDINPVWNIIVWTPLRDFVVPYTVSFKAIAVGLRRCDWGPEFCRPDFPARYLDRTWTTVGVKESILPSWLLHGLYKAQQYSKYYCPGSDTVDYSSEW